MKLGVYIVLFQTTEFSSQGAALRYDCNLPVMYSAGCRDSITKGFRNEFLTLAVNQGNRKLCGR